MRKIYLDYGAMAPVCEDVRKRLKEMSYEFYNASSIYEYGILNNTFVENTRIKVAQMINADPDEIIFVSSCSEANALAINGFLNKHADYDVVSSNIEHSSILNNPKVKHILKCNNKGIVDYKDCNKEKTLYAVMLANNEIGTIQPIKKISQTVHKNNSFILCDCATAFGKMDIDVKELDVDMLSASGAKIGSLPGVGFLYVKRGVEISPIIYGTQNNGNRGGTYNHLAIKSLAIAIDNLKKEEDFKVLKMRNYLLEILLKHGDITLNGCSENRILNNVNICIHNINIDAQQIISLLDMEGFMVSAGSACHSGSIRPSHVLKAIGLSDDDANHSVRITIGKENTFKDLELFARCLFNIIKIFK